MITKPKEEGTDNQIFGLHIENLRSTGNNGILDMVRTVVPGTEITTFTGGRTIRKPISIVQERKVSIFPMQNESSNMEIKMSTELG